MNTHSEKKIERKTQANTFFNSGEHSSLQFVNNRPETVAQKKLQELANNHNLHSKDTTQLKAVAENYMATQQSSIQKKENNTGLPDNLKIGIENLSGYSMNDVKVHYNSDKPAQLQAHAYAQGTDIHLASGQEKHLPHEAWHVVQQKQNRVKPTMQMNGGVYVNDNKNLEKEADILGNQALQMKAKENNGKLNSDFITQAKNNENATHNPIKLTNKNQSIAIDTVQRVINITEGTKNITTEQAVEMAKRKYPTVIGLSPEIFKSIIHFLTSYSNAEQTFETEKQLWNQLDHDLNEESKERAEKEDRDEYFHSGLELLSQHDALVNRFSGFLSEMYTEGTFDEAIRAETLFDILKDTAKRLEKVVAENTLPDVKPIVGHDDEEALISDYNLDGLELYRAERIPASKTISKADFPLYGFFSTSLKYAKQYYTGGSKGSYDTMIKITLNKPIGNVLIELLKERSAFKQNAGEVGNALTDASETDGTQKSVEKKLYKNGIIDRKGKLAAGLKRNMMGGENRKNAPNALMIKQEPDAETQAPITNIEITSRLLNKGNGLLIEHPLDKYVVKVEKMKQEEINQ